MSINKWGPPVWTLFHCLADKIKEEKFRELGPQLFLLLKKICSNLPCPDCSMHATLFLSKVNFNYIKTKEDFKNMIYIFHNMVNKRKNKPMFNVTDLTVYSNINLINAFNKFVDVYHTHGNMKLLADSFQRKLIVKDIKSWVMKNYNNFEG